jgi:hypothetical protein
MVEHLPSKHNVLSSTPTPSENKKDSSLYNYTSQDTMRLVKE